MPDIPTPPPSASRRDRKAQAAPGLVAATQVRTSRVPGAVAVGVRGGWLIAGGIAVAVVVALSGTIVATGFGGPTTAISAEAQDLRAGDLADDPCTQAAAGEAGGSVHRISTCEHIGDTPTIQDDVAQTSEAGAVPTPRATPGPGASDRFRPRQTAPNTPSAPAPGGPNAPAPAPAPG
ncbi:MAG TPA: hypothetical protein DIW46_05925, partial [Microbacterium sp.]|nr:hypothetical protein [Microbacterium sp.]